MKWAAGILVVVLYVVWPYYTLLELAEAIKSDDATAINEVVDWASVRTNFKMQLEARLDKMPQTAAEQKDPGAAAFGKTFALTLANSVIDKLLTPDGISRAMQIARESKKPQDVTPSDRPSVQEKPQNDFYKRIKFAFFVSLVDFRLDLRTPSKSPSNDPAVTVMLAFRGMGWKVTEIRFPDTDLSKVAQASGK